MTPIKRLLALAALPLVVVASPTFAQSSAVKQADQKDRRAQEWRVKHEGDGAAVKRANANDRRDIAHRDRAATADARASERDAKAQQWRLKHEGDSAAVKRANARDQASIDYRNSHSSAPK